jgi:hypothetical protein
MMPAGPRSLLVVLALLPALAGASPAAAQPADPEPVGPDDTAQIVPLGMTIDNAPNPVLGADGVNHLAYEITIVNQTGGAVTIESVQTRSGDVDLGARLGGRRWPTCCASTASAAPSSRVAAARSW